jgi:hypothetical protein
MKTRIFIAGGYGLIGSNIARHVRKIDRDTEIILAGRNPEKGETLAQELGRARTAYLDLEYPHKLEDLGQIDLIVAALHDPADILIHFAMEHSIAHIGITKLAGDVGPIIFSALQSPPKRPIVLLGHSNAGVTTIVSQKASEDFSSIDSIDIAALYDELDPIGPMNTKDFESNAGLSDRFLLREGCKWAWMDAKKHTRPFRISNESILEGFPVALLDVPSLAAITKAARVRWDFVQGESIGTKAGSQASHDVYIDIEGILKSGKTAKRRTVLSDPNGQAHITALGVLIAIERVLGLDGHPAADGGVYLPETLVSPDAAITRLNQFGVQIFTSSIA